MEMELKRSKSEIVALKEFLMKICKKINFGNYEKSVQFLEKAISGKIVADFQSFKTT